MKFDRARSTVRRGLALAVTTAAVTAAGVAVSLATATPALADTALACDQNTIYGIDSSGNVDAINVTTGTATTVRSMSPAYNALGLTLSGTAAIGFSGTSGQITRYDTAAGTLTTYNGVDASAPTTIIRGAVNPATGIYYYGGNGTSAYLGAFNANTNTPIGQVGTITGLANGNGDFAFSTRGLMFVVAANTVMRVDDPAPPTTAGNQTLTTSLVATLPAGTNSPGIAFSTDGYLYVSSGSSLLKLDPASGALLATLTISGGFTPTDLASCNYPNTISTQASVSERVNPGDQFGLSETGGGIVSGNTATTAGSATGVQPQVAGAALTIPTRSYTAIETAAATTDLDDYATSYSCVDANDGTVEASGTGTVASFVFPAATSAEGTDVVCTFTNTPRTATLGLGSTLSSSRADPSDQFTAAVRSDSATGTVLNPTTDSTTSGIDSTVTAGTGATGTTTVVAARTYYLTDALTGGAASSTGQYQATVTCTDANGLQSGLPTGAPFTGTLAVTPVPGAAIDCTADYGTVAPTIAVSSALGSPRYDDTDQFTVAVRSGSASGTVLNPTGNSTTSGTGTTVTAGSGTTGAITATVGGSYVITGAPTADAGRYAASVTCTDANGYQDGLPAGAPFTGSLAITPVAGAAISCVVSESASPASLLLIKTNPASLVVGQPAGYTLDVTNNGGTASPATVADQLPADLQYTGSGGTGWSCTATGTVTAGQLVTCQQAAVPAGATAELTLTVTPTPAAAGTSVANHASVDPTGGSNPTDPAGCTTSDPATGCAVTPAVLVGSGIDLALDQANPASLTVGVPSQYVLTVSDNGTGPAPTATVTDLLPAGLTYAGASGAACSAAGQLVTCTLTGPIAPGGSQSFALSVVPTSAAAGTSLINNATIDPSGGTAPIDPATCTSTGTPTGCAVTGAMIPRTATLQLAMTATPVAPGTAPLHRGDRVDFTYTATNTSSTTLSGLTVTSTAAGPINCAATSLAPGASTTCRPAGPYAVTQADVDRGAVTANATASADLAACTGTCTPIASNPAGSTTPTDTHPGVGISQVGTLDDRNHDGKANPGETISYLVTVTDTGTTTLSGIAVSDPGVTLSCPATTLEPGQAMRCTGTHTVTAQDAAAGAVQAVATVTANTPSATKTMSATAVQVSIAAATTPTDPPAASGHDPADATKSLASTGSDLVPAVTGAGLLLVLGLLLLVAGRRRTYAYPPRHTARHQGGRHLSTSR
jgi:conserved repeat domain